VLWTALDAWSGSGLPKTEAIKRIEQTATDSRTIRRLLSPDEQRRQRLEEIKSLDEGRGTTATAIEPSKYGPYELPVEER
jgi:hypothetical protein